MSILDLMEQLMLRKLVFFFSRNFEARKRESILNTCHFAAALGIGKYLGSIYCPGKLKKTGHKNMIEKMAAKLSEWNATYLSMAGRVTVTKSVMGGMSSYSM